MSDSRLKRMLQEAEANSFPHFITYCKLITALVPAAYKYDKGSVKYTALEEAISKFMTEKLEREIKCYWIKDELTFATPITNSVEGSLASLTQLTHRLEALMVEFTETPGKKFSMRESYVLIEQQLPPNLKIEFKNITLQFGAVEGKSISLANIHKQLKCEKLQLYGLSKIKGSVLGLIKIPGLKELDNFTGETAKWFDIVDRHFQTDKDILAAQEEMIEAGLKEYAKL